MANRRPARHQTTNVCTLTAAENVAMQAIITYTTDDAAAASIGVKATTFRNRIRLVCEKLGVRGRRDAIDIWRGRAA